MDLTQYRKNLADLRLSTGSQYADLLAKRKNLLKEAERQQEELALLQRQQEEEAKRQTEQNWFSRLGQTILDVPKEVIGGALKGIEGLVDAGIGLWGEASNKLFGIDNNWAEKAISYDATGNLFSSWADNLTKGSYMNGTIFEDIAQGVGQMLPPIAVSLIPGGGLVASKLVFAASAAGLGMERALNDGANFDNAALYGALSGGTELLIEGVSGGIGGKAAGKVFGKTVAKSAGGRLLTGVLGEAAEEVASDLINPVLKKVSNVPTTENDKISFNSLLRTATVGGAVGGIIGGASRRFTKEAGVADTVQENKVLETKINNLQAQLNDSTENKKAKIKEKIAEAYKEKTANEEGIATYLKSLNAEKRARITEKYGLASRYTEAGDRKRTYTQEAGVEPVEGKRGLYLVTTTTQEGKKDKVYRQTEPLTNNAMSLSLIDEDLRYAPTHGALTEAQKEAMRVISNLSPKTRFVATDMELLGNMAYDPKTRVIYIPKEIDAETSVRKVAVHEITHTLEGTQQYAKLQQYLLEDEGFQKFVDERKERYAQYADMAQASNESAGVQDYLILTEATADYMGEMLLRDPRSIQRLANSQKSLVRRIYEWIKEKIKSLFKRGAIHGAELRELRSIEKLYLNAMKVSVGGFPMETLRSAFDDDDAQSANRPLLTDNTDKSIREESNKGQGDLRYFLRSEKPFEKQVDEVLNGTSKASHITIVDKMPAIYTELKIPDKPLLMTAKHTYLAINNKGKYDGKSEDYHGLGKELFLQIPKALENPIMIWESSKTQSSNDIIILLDMFDRENRPIIVPVLLDGKGKVNFVNMTANIMKSAYGRDNFANFINNNVNTDNILLLDSKKTRNLYNRFEKKIPQQLQQVIDGARVTMPKDGNASGSYNNIIRTISNNSQADLRFSLKKSFAEQVDLALDGKLETYNHIRVMAHTPQILQDVGVADTQVLTKKTVIEKIASKHDLTREQIKSLPQKMGEPFLVMQSISEGKENSVIEYIQDVDKNHLPIMIAIEVEGVGMVDNQFIIANIITSAYGKDNFAYTVRQAIKQDKILYYNKKRLLSLGVNKGLYLPNILQDLQPYNNIIRKVGTESQGVFDKNLRYSLKDSFEKQLNDLSKTSNNYLRVSETPQILKDIGIDSDTVIMSKMVVKKLLFKHDITLSMIKQLPDKLKSPYLIIKSNDETKSNTVIEFIEMTDKNNIPVLVAIDIDTTPHKESEYVIANIITSAYGKDNFNSYIRTAINKDTSNEPHILYYNEKRLQSLQAVWGKLSPDLQSELQPYNNIVRRIDEDSQGVFDKNLRYSLKDSIKTLDRYTDEEAKRIEKNRMKKIAYEVGDIVDFVEFAVKDNRLENSKLYLGKINNALASRIVKSTDLEVRGYDIVLNRDDLRHIFKGQGDTKTESARGQLAVTQENVFDIVDTIITPDKVASTKKSGTNETEIIFEKDINGKHTAITFIKNDTKALSLKTGYIKKESITSKNLQENLDKIIDKSEKRGTIIEYGNKEQNAVGGIQSGGDSNNASRDVEKLRTLYKTVYKQFNRRDKEILGRWSVSGRSRFYSDSLTNTKTNTEIKVYKDVDGTTFYEVFKANKTVLYNGDLVDLHDVNYYKDATNYLSADGLSGFSITKDGDLTSVFNSNAENLGWLRTIAPIVKERVKTLDCYDVRKAGFMNLPEAYSKIFNFSTASTMDFNPELDKVGIGKNYGNPDVAFMVNTKAEVTPRHFNKDNYDGAKEYQESFVHSEERKPSKKQREDEARRNSNNLRVQNSALKKENAILQKTIEIQNEKIPYPRDQKANKVIARRIIEEKAKDKKYTSLKINIFKRITKAKEYSKRTYSVTAGILAHEEIKGFIGYVAGLHRENSNEFTGDIRERMAKLSKVYNEKNVFLKDAEVENNGLETATFTQYYDPDIKDAIDMIANGEGTLKIEELRALDVVTKGLLHLYKTYDTIFRNGKRENLKEVVTKEIPILQRTAKMQKRGGMFEGFRNITKQYIRNVIDPSVVFKQLDNFDKNGRITIAYKDIQEGDTKAQVARVEMLQPIETFLKETKGYKKSLGEKKTVKLGNETVDLTKGQAIYLYLLSKRKQANIFKSGVTIADRGKYKKEYRNITEKNIKNIEKTFTKEDLEFIKILHDLFNKEAMAKKVETDEALYGYAKIEDTDNYVPIKRSGSDIAQKLGSDKGILNMIQQVDNMSFNKDTVKGARLSIELNNIMDIATKHIDDMAIYYGLAVPIKNFNLILNKKIKLGDGSTTSLLKIIQSDIEGGSGSIIKYINNFLNDLQGVKRDTGAVNMALEKIRGNFAKFQLGLNVGTILKQGGSYITASIYLDGTSLFKALFMKSNKEQMFKYAPITKARFHDTSYVKSQTVYDEKASTKLGKALDKVGDITTKGITLADNAVIRKLWNASQIQIERNGGGKIGTEENLTKAGELLETIIRETQSNAIMSERSGFARNSNALVRAFTMFMSDAQKQFSRLYEGRAREKVIKWRLKNESKEMTAQEIAELEAELKEVKRYNVRAVSAVVMTTIYISLIGMFMNWFLDRDEKDKPFMEQFARNFGTDAVGMLPFLRDIVGKMINGYNVEVYAISSINNLATALKNFSDFGLKIIKGEPLERWYIGKQLRGLSFSIGQFAGLPVRNLYNLVYGLTAKFSPEAAWEMKSFFYGTTGGLKEAQNAYTQGATRKAKAIIGVIIGDRIGNASSSVLNEIGDLTLKGFNAMPKDVGTRIKIGGEEYILSSKQQKEFNKIYQQANAIADKMVKTTEYTKLDDKTKAKTILALYNYYYNIACEELFGVSIETKLKLFSLALPLERLLPIIAYCQSLESDKDKNGKTVTGSIKAKIVKYLKTLSLLGVQKYIIMGYLGYVNTSGATSVKLYINRLKLSKTDKEDLYEMSGYETIKKVAS